MPSAPPKPIATRRDAILDAAADVFLRYGYRKTSMDDLARAAGLSRQGLYLYFPTKDTIFHDSVVLLASQRLQAVRATLAGERGTIESRLLDTFIGLSSDADGHPMAQENLVELLNTATALAGPAVAAFDEALSDALVEALRSSGVASAWKAVGIPAKSLARHLLAASTGIRRSTGSDADYREQMRVAVRVVCRGAALDRVA